MESINLIDKVRDTLRVHHYSLRREQAYVQWIRRYINFHNNDLSPSLVPALR
jgi:hypothetical protein